MTDSTSAGDREIKALSKEAIVKRRSDNRELSYLSAETLEDIGLSRAIEERTCPYLGNKSESVSKEEVFKALRS